MQKNKKQNVYNYRYYSSVSRRPVENTPQKPYGYKFSIFKKISIVIALVLLTIGAYGVYNKRVQAHDLDMVEQFKVEQQTKAAEWNSAQATINNVLSSNQGIDFEIATTDINTGSKQNYGDMQPVFAASVGKLVTAADYLHESEIGQESMNATLDNGDNAAHALKQMIIVSDDPSWVSLNDKLTYGQLQSYGNSVGLSSFDAIDNLISARDVANLLASLYQGKLLNKSDTNLLLSYMQQANYRNLIVPAVPSGDTVYHKVGEYNDNVNDAAIVTNGNKAVVLVIMTNGNGIFNWSNRATLMQQIASPIFKYYVN